MISAQPLIWVRRSTSPKDISSRHRKSSPTPDACLHARWPSRRCPRTGSRTSPKGCAVSSRQAEGNPESQAQRLLARLMIGEGSYRSFATTAPAIFERVTMDDIDRWRKDVLVREGIIVVAAGPLGDRDRPHGRSAVRRSSAGGKTTTSCQTDPAGAWQAGCAGAAGGRHDYRCRRSNGARRHSRLARTAAAVAALGGNPSARLWKAVRERLGGLRGFHEPAASRP